MMRILILSCLAFCVSVPYVFADGIETLIDVGKSQAEMQKKYKSETAIYEDVLKGYKSGAIKTGAKRQEIMNRYGDPVVIVDDHPRKREKWVYKPAATSFLDGGERINMYFDAAGDLEEIKIEK